MRRAAKLDANHSKIVAALRQVGATVLDLSAVGGGCPDLLVGYRGHDLLMEVKDGEKKPSQRRLRPNQVEFCERWRGKEPVKVETVDEALRIIGAIK